MDKVYIVMCEIRHQSLLQTWCGGVFLSKDRAEDAKEQFIAGSHCDEAYVLEEEILDAKVGVS